MLPPVFLLFAGGASSGLAALLLKEQGYNVGAVYAFSPYKMGTTCKTDEMCWSTVYKRHLGNVTWTFWNNQVLFSVCPIAAPGLASCFS